MFGEVQKEATVLVFSATGQEVARENVQGSRTSTISLEGESGIYNVMIVLENGAQQYFRVVRR